MYIKVVKGDDTHVSSNRKSIMSIDKEFLKDIVSKVVKDTIDITDKDEVDKQATNVLNELKKIGNLTNSSNSKII